MYIYVCVCVDIKYTKCFKITSDNQKLKVYNTKNVEKRSFSYTKWKCDLALLISRSIR